MICFPGCVERQGYIAGSSSYKSTIPTYRVAVFSVLSVRFSEFPKSAVKLVIASRSLTSFRAQSDWNIVLVSTVKNAEY